MKPTVEQRFWAKVNKTDTCWLWTAYINPSGYGMFCIRGKVARLSHRVSYAMAHGEIGDNLLDHICGVRACVYPGHLRIATRKQNGENLTCKPLSSSGYRGVSYRKDTSRWAAYVTHNQVRFHLGFYSTAEEAAEVARLARCELFTHNQVDRARAH